MIYCEMLGHDCSFGYIKCIEVCPLGKGELQLSACKNVYLKKVGYLAAASCIGPEHEFRFMVINMLQKVQIVEVSHSQDMTSSDHTEVANALIATSMLITTEMIPAVITPVSNLLTHKREFVRKRALLALHRFYQLDKTSICQLNDQICKMLCDADPSVMTACVVLLDDMCKDDPSIGKNLVPSLVSIQKQIIEQRLPRDYDYHNIPAPWVQIKIIRLLSRLGYGDQLSSEKMYAVIADTMARADAGNAIGHAISYECIRCVVHIYPNAELLDSASKATAFFINNPLANLKYLGLNALGEMVKENPAVAATHQTAVMNCLQSDDEALKRKAIDLLFAISNENNVQVVIEKMLDFLKKTTDEYFQVILINRVNDLAERFAPNPSWYIKTITQLFLAAGDVVPSNVASTVMRLLEEGQGDPDIDYQMRSEAVAMYLELMDEPKLPEVFVQVLAFILGQYGETAEAGVETVIQHLCALFERQSDVETKGYCLNAIMKNCNKYGGVTDEANMVLKECLLSHNVDLQQRGYMFQVMMDEMGLMNVAYPSAAEDAMFEVDESLSFLQTYVDEMRINGAPEYNPPEDSEEEREEEANQLKVDAYAAPEVAKPAAVNFNQPAEPAAAAPAQQGFFGTQTASQPAAQPASGADLFSQNKTADLFGTSNGFFGAPSESTKVTTPQPTTPTTNDTAYDLFSSTSGNALFGGISEPAKPAAPAPAAQPAQAQSNAFDFGFGAPAQPAQAQSNAFDFGFGTASAAPAPAAQPAQAQSNAFDFGFGAPAAQPAQQNFGFSAPAAQQAPAQQAPAAQSNTFDFGWGAPAAQQAPAQPAQAQSNAFDFGFGAPAAQPAQQNFGFGAPAAQPAQQNFGFGAPAAQPAQQNFGFGAPAQPAQQNYGFGAPAPAVDPFAGFGF